VIAENAERKPHLVCEPRKLVSLPIDGWCVAGGAEPRPGSALFGHIEP
jgi:hypothetical protein